MITRITIRSEPYSRTYKDRLTVTRSSVRYEYEPFSPTAANPQRKWTVKSTDPEFERMFRNLCDEVESLMSRESTDTGLDNTVFAIMKDDGDKEEKTLCEPDERYTVCFTIIDQMIRYANRMQGQG